MGFKPKNISAIKDALENGEDDKDFSQESGGLQVDNGNESNFKEKLGFNIEKAVVNVEKGATDQSKLINLIEELIKELRKPKRTADPADEDVEDNNQDGFEDCPNDYVDYDDGDEEPVNKTKCLTDTDLVEECKKLTSTISSYHKKNQ